MSTFRLGKREKLVLQTIYNYQYRSFYLEDFFSNELQRIINMVNERSNSRTAFAKIIQRLHEKRLICMLENNEVNLQKFVSGASKPFIYGRGKYQRLIGLTVKGKEIVKEEIAIDRKEFVKREKRSEEFEYYLNNLSQVLTYLRTEDERYHEFIDDKVFWKFFKDDFGYRAYTNPGLKEEIQSHSNVWTYLIGKGLNPETA